VIRVGRETFRCKCPKEWRTDCTEWAHLTPDLRRSYFLSSAEIGVLAISTLVPPFFAYFVDGWKAAGTAARWGFTFGLAFAALLWMIKMAIVFFSLRRVAHSVPPRGGWPWNW